MLAPICDVQQPRLCGCLPTLIFQAAVLSRDFHHACRAHRMLFYAAQAGKRHGRSLGDFASLGCLRNLDIFFFFFDPATYSLIDNAPTVAANVGRENEDNAKWPRYRRPTSRERQNSACRVKHEIFFKRKMRSRNNTRNTVL